MSAVGRVEAEMSSCCIGSEFALASVHDVDRVPLADADVICNVSDDVAGDIVQFVFSFVREVVDLAFDLVKDTLIAIIAIIATLAARFTIFEDVLAKVGCVELFCESATNLIWIIGCSDLTHPNDGIIFHEALLVTSKQRQVCQDKGDKGEY